MRLVRDDEYEMTEQVQAEEESDRITPAQPQDQPDGALDEAEDAVEEASAEVQVDLRTLEALLFSTHHPLTAGRLAELLELESTKAVRRSIRELNEQYITS